MANLVFHLQETRGTRFLGFQPTFISFSEMGPQFCFLFCFVSFFFIWRTTSFLILILCVLVKWTLFHSGFRVGCDSGLPVKNLTLASVTGIGASLNQGQREATWNFAEPVRLSREAYLGFWFEHGKL